MQDFKPCFINTVSQITLSLRTFVNYVFHCLTIRSTITWQVGRQSLLIRPVITPHSLSLSRSPFYPNWTKAFRKSINNGTSKFKQLHSSCRSLVTCSASWTRTTVFAKLVLSWNLIYTNWETKRLSVFLDPGFDKNEAIILWVRECRVSVGVPWILGMIRLIGFGSITRSQLSMVTRELYNQPRMSSQ